MFTKRTVHAHISRDRRFVLHSLSRSLCSLSRPDAELPQKYNLHWELDCVGCFLAAGWSNSVYSRQDQSVFFKSRCNRFDEEQEVLSAGESLDAVVHRPLERGGQVGTQLHAV